MNQQKKKRIFLIVMLVIIAFIVYCIGVYFGWIPVYRCETTINGEEKCEWIDTNIIG
jgi:hypothetical protein